jgi:hypothetical protein
MSLRIELENSAEQTAFNLKRWTEVLADPDLARLPHRIETDRHGHIGSIFKRRQPSVHAQSFARNSRTRLGLPDLLRRESKLQGRHHPNG